jgi:tetratricopeptide (TPR) repeat protein
MHHKHMSSARWISLIATAILAMASGCDSRKPPELETPKTQPAQQDTSIDLGIPAPPSIDAADLPDLEPLDAFRKDQSSARALCRQFQIPELPDVSKIDPKGQEQFYGAFQRLRANPNDANQYGLLGQLYAAQRFAELAVTLLERAAGMAPNDHRWYYSLALQLEKTGDFDRAKRLYIKASQLNPDYTPVWMRLAWRAVDKNDRDAAKTYLDRYITQHPDVPFGYVERAQLHYDDEQLDAVQQDLQKAQSKGSIGRKGHRLLGALYGRLNRLDDQTFHLQMSKAALPLELDDPLAITVRRLETVRNPVISRFNGLVESQRWADALAVSDQALKAATDQKARGTVLGTISECHRQLGDYRKAYEYAFQACQASPDKPDPFVSVALSLVFGTRDCLPAALNAANKAIELEPELDTAHYARGLILIQVAQRIAELPPDSQPVEERSRLLKHAVDDLEYCISQKPVDLNYLVALATAHGMASHFDRAAKLLDTAIRISPNDPKIIDLKRKVDARQPL